MKQDPQGDGLARWSMGGPGRLRELLRIFPELAIKTAFPPQGQAEGAPRDHL